MLCQWYFLLFESRHDLWQTSFAGLYPLSQKHESFEVGADFCFEYAAYAHIDVLSFQLALHPQDPYVSCCTGIKSSHSINAISHAAQ